MAKQQQIWIATWDVKYSVALAKGETAKSTLGWRYLIGGEEETLSHSLKHASRKPALAQNTHPVMRIPESEITQVSHYHSVQPRVVSMICSNFVWFQDDAGRYVCSHCQAHRHDTVCEVESLFHTISVVDVNVNVQHTGEHLQQSTQITSSSGPQHQTCCMTHVCG